jgi:hypothetical protein
LRLTKTLAALCLAALVVTGGVAGAQKGRGTRASAARAAVPKQVTVTLVRWPYT